MKSFVLKQRNLSTVLAIGTRTSRKQQTKKYTLCSLNLSKRSLLQLASNKAGPEGFLLLFCQARDILPLRRTKPGRLSGHSIFCYAVSTRGSRDGHVAASITENPFEKSLAPRRYSKWFKRFQVGLRRYMTHQAPFGKWAHDYDP